MGLLSRRCLLSSPPLGQNVGLLSATMQHPVLNTNTSTLRPYANHTTTSTAATTSSSHPRLIPSPPLLLLEGDCLPVSHQGVARTYYHLLDHHAVGMEEWFHVAAAAKTFVLRADPMETNGGSATTAPMGRHILRHVPIQEIIPPDTPTTTPADQSSAGTGAMTWESSLVMALYLGQAAESVRWGHVLEIGAGVGVGAILLSHILQQQQNANVWRRSPSWSSITLTDGNDACLQQCRTNVRRAWPSNTANGGSTPRIQVSKLDWNEDCANTSTCADKTCVPPQQYDTILACDVCYVPEDIDALVRTIQTRLKRRHGAAAHFFGPYNRAALQQLIQRFQQEMQVTVEPLHLQRYRLQPHDDDDDRRIGPYQEGWPAFPSPSCLEQDCPYVTKSQATILHVTVRHRRPSDAAANGATAMSNTVLPPSGDIRDLD